MTVGMFVTRCIRRRGSITAVLFERLCAGVLEYPCLCTKARMDVFVSCVAQALPLCRVVQRRFMFSYKGLQQELRRRRWWRQSPNSYGEERRRSVLHQVKWQRRVMLLISHHPLEKNLTRWGQRFLKGGRMIWAGRRRLRYALDGGGEDGQDSGHRMSDPIRTSNISDEDGDLRIQKTSKTEDGLPTGFGRPTHRTSDI